MKLSYYLFNDSVNNFEDLYIAEKVNEDNGYFELFPKNDNIEFEFKAFIQKNKAKPPKWIGFLNQDLDIPFEEEMRNTVNSFVILIKIIKDEMPYFFAVTGGFGFTAINRDKLENNFGLRFALNTIDSKELKAFDVRNIDLKTKQKRVLFNRGSEIGEFDLDFEQDLINLVSGKSKNEEIGTTVKGSTASLNLSSKVDFASLGEKCAQILEVYLSNDYKEDFGFIDNIKVVKDKSVIELLNQKLFETVSNGETHHISLAYPDMIEYDRCTNYHVRFRRKTVETEEVTIENVYNLLEQVGLDSAEQIEKVKIIGFDDSDSPVTGPVGLNHFIIYQTEIESGTYIFSLNNWYKIANDYFTKIQHEMMKIPYLDKEDFLTDIYKGEKEGDYNERQDSEYYVCLDKKNFQVKNSMSKIEVSDLYSRDKHFVCVKKETASATLSHLFAQGSVSMQLLKESEEYRQFLIEKVKESFPEVKYDADTFPFDECTLVYAISSDKTGDLRDILPFFSKVNLLHHINLIKRLGIRVEVYKIDVIEVENI